ncbi:polyhydroxyalkanoate granule-associated phasin [uncultured Piscinibacter sp.]|uniref:polyhydroxyalkanoate granule-associated phasin n=1 Tax=uncultured Piscinibacter sp. TaxID=1131835 RepID=UPI0026177BED|nr:polyhydroxyalkanoate granule-associated phasin [uncultured Piscinibacter sp.]
MTSRRNSKSIAAKTAQLSVAVPQVVSHRVTRMAIAGTPMSKRDREEFKRMVDEKKVAFTEALVAMAAQTARANQALAMSMLRSFWFPSLRRGPSPLALAAQLQGAALGVLAKGIAPVHRKAVANAKRLAKTKLR